MSEITRADIHNAIVVRPDCEKISFAITCQLYGVKPEIIEETIANVINGAVRVIEPVLDYYSRRI